MIDIKATTVSSLRQIDKTENDTIMVKRGLFRIDFDGVKKTLYSPIYTANGFRGLIRRTATNIILTKLKEKNIDLGGATNFHLMNAGGGNNYQAQSFEIEDKVRELNPLVSMLGTSLAVTGKLSISDLVPMEVAEDGMKLCYRVNDSGALYSSIVQVENIIKKDDMLDHTGNANFMSSEEIIEWENFVSENQSKRMATKDKGAKDKVKKESIKHIQGRESVIAGVDFYSSISTIDGVTALTDIEKGLLVRTLEKVVKHTLGSNSNTGSGRMNYTVTLFGDSTITAVCDPRFIYKVEVETDYTDEVQGYCNAFDAWLDSVTEENIQLDKVLA